MYNFTWENITITNAWPNVEHKNLTNRSEPTDKEICAAQNIARLEVELNQIHDLIICSGGKAKTAINKCNFPPNIKIIYIPHLSTRGMKSIKKDINGNNIPTIKSITSKPQIKRKIAKSNLQKRLEVICQNIAQEYQPVILEK